MENLKMDNGELVNGEVPTIIYFASCRDIMRK